MLPAPDGNTVLVVIAFFVISSLVISILLIVAVNIGRWVYDRYAPQTFSLSATNQRLENETRRTVRAERKQALSRSVSMISVSSHGMMPMVPADFDANSEPSDVGIDLNNSGSATPSEIDGEQPVSFVVENERNERW